MGSIAEHYDEHLAEHYSWLFGGLPERARENRAFFDSIGLRASVGARALDVGAGSGFQSIPLAELGYAVTAVDLSAKLLAELRANAKELAIETLRDDILACIPNMPTGAFDVCVCMGDTLTHLGGFGEVQRLLRDVHRVLAPGGRFVIALRDFTSELRGEQRFVPVRSDATTVFSCFLEYDGDHVRVYDVIHLREETGWKMRVSSYKKLRIAPDWLEKRAVELGFDVTQTGVVHGMTTIVLRKR